MFWLWLKWILSPVGRFLSLILFVLVAITTIFVKGRNAGIDAERRRSAKKVRTVQKKMDAETDKVLSDREVIDKLKDGSF